VDKRGLFGRLSSRYCLRSVAETILYGFVPSGASSVNPIECDPMVKSWIFQANPAIYRIREALDALDEITWTVKQYRDEIQVGDKAWGGSVCCGFFSSHK
jgi:hypothetical protein